MKRHDSLIPLTHDHHHALSQARCMQLAADSAPDGRLAQTREFLQFFETDTVAHFQEEEESVFPMVIDEEEAQPFLSRAMLDHLRIYAFVRLLRSEIARGDVSGVTMTRLAETLQHHIRFEEKVLFPMIERMVPNILLCEVSLQPRQRAVRQNVLIGIE